MQTPTTPLSRSVLGATELTLMSPLKRGLIDAALSCSYETRASMVLATLQAMGSARREVDTTPMIRELSDSIRAIRSFRFSIIGQEQRCVLLSVSFDGGWEPYLRRVWRVIGPVLDLIFFNCEGHLNSRTHSYADYIAYVRRIQVPTGFYYEGSPIKVTSQRQTPDDLPPEAIAVLAPRPDLFEQARAGLVALYRLADYHTARPPSEDHVTLLRAARALLPELEEKIRQPINTVSGGRHTPSEEAAWRWLGGGLPLDAPEPAANEVDVGNLQGGILEPQAGVGHACLALVGLDGPQGVMALIDHLRPMVSSAAPADPSASSMRVNLSFTCAGLELAGLDADSIRQLPQEFREGMEARASVLGDWLTHHPSKWTLPERYGNSGSPRVELSRVHALVQFNLPSEVTGDWKDLDDTEKLPLRHAVQALDAALDEKPGAGRAGRVLSVQAMQRYDSTSPPLRGHFDFKDGLSQPNVGAQRPEGVDDSDTVPAGDLLLGYVNSFRDPPLRGPLWKDSTFQVIRKYRLFPEVLRDQVPNTEAQEKLLGRRKDGSNFITETTDNQFVYDQDEQGRMCPLHSHVRRANPRRARGDLEHIPRILRRGMSYGPLYDEAKGNGSAERGVVFMAYNASIAEQFEVIQGWLSGANSASPGLAAGLRDPFLGVPLEGDPRRYAWTDAARTEHFVDLPADPPRVSLQWGIYAFVPSHAAMQEIHRAAHRTLDEDRAREQQSAIRGPSPPPDDFVKQRVEDRRRREEAEMALRGGVAVAKLRQAEQALGLEAARSSWKAALEDEGARRTGLSPAIWAYIRKAHGGVLRTPLGVLVASKALVMDIFNDASGRYTVTGYNARLSQSFGEIYLGFDPGERYDKESLKVNQAIMAVSLQEAFVVASKGAASVISSARSLLNGRAAQTVEVRDLVDEFLAKVCPDWFGLPDSAHVHSGGWHQGDKLPASCPAHFHAPSLYTFQPQPGEATTSQGKEHGQLLKTAVSAYVKAVRANAVQSVGKIGKQIFAAFDDDPEGNERVTASLIGAMMGMLPTIDGSLRGVLYEWVRDRSFWDLQAELLADKPEDPLAHAQKVLLKPLHRALQSRPVPEMVWRTARMPHNLGAGPSQVQIRTGDIVVASMVSAMQEDRVEDRADPFVSFGGDRRADVPAQHACPGYHMAMGVMLGFLYGLMSDAKLRPATSPLALRFVA